MKISPEEVTTMREYLTKLAYSQNENSYNELYEQFSKFAPISGETLL